MNNKGTSEVGGGGKERGTTQLGVLLVYAINDGNREWKGMDGVID
jgi:hypothetical protein